MRAKLYAALGATAFAAVALVDTGLRANHGSGFRSLAVGPVLGVLAPPYELPYEGTANLLSMVWAGSSMASRPRCPFATIADQACRSHCSWS